MGIIKCDKGHFYDDVKYERCPHCESNVNSFDKIAGGGERGIYRRDLVITDGISDGIWEDDGLTGVICRPLSPSTDPVVGWLVCIGGAHFGEDFRLKTGRNFIGGSREMDVALINDKSVSGNKHAIIVYEPQRHIFHVLTGEARELCYLNDEVVLSSLQLKPHDIITVGNTQLMFIPCCDDRFNWDMVDTE